MDAPDLNRLADEARTIAEQAGHGEFLTTLVAYDDTGSRVFLAPEHGQQLPFPEVVDVMRQQNGRPPHTITVMFDGYISDADLSHGTMHEAFATGNPRVFEAITTMIITQRTIESAFDFYRYTPSEGWEWTDRQFLTHELHSDPFAPQ